VVDPPPPAEVKTTEELYLDGLRMEQFRSPTGDPNLYWQEALRRDPSDIRVNTVLGIDAIKGGRFADAERLLRKALERDTASYTSPKDGEPIYYLGLALKSQGKLDEAYAEFYKATWSAAWRSPGYFALAEIDATRGDFNAALIADEDALEANANNIRGAGAEGCAAAPLRAQRRGAGCDCCNQQDRSAGRAWDDGAVAGHEIARQRRCAGKDGE